jgi:hypothetical protein
MVMTKKLFLMTVLSLSLALAGQAQGVSQKLAIGVEAGLYGPGITLATSLSPNFKLKVALDRLNYQYNGSFDLNVDGYVQEPGVVELGESLMSPELGGSLMNPKLDFLNGKIMIDCYPMQNGIFSLSVGLYAGNNSISVAGKIDNFSAYPGFVFELEDAVVKPNPDGSFEAKLNLGSTIKPYVGFGLGRTIANSRIGFKLDFGLVYQGNYKFDEGKNVTLTGLGMSDRMNKLAEDLDVPEWILKCWPMVNVSLSCRLF